MSDPKTRLPLTTVSLYVLLAVAEEARHGYGIIKDIEARTHGLVSLEAGTLYAAIKRLQDEGLLRADASKRAKDVDSRRRYYRLTPLGLEVLRRECDRLAEVLQIARQKHVLPAPGRAGR